MAAMVAVVTVGVTEATMEAAPEAAVSLVEWVEVESSLLEARVERVERSGAERVECQVAQTAAVAMAVVATAAVATEAAAMVVVAKAVAVMVVVATAAAVRVVAKMVAVTGMGWERKCCRRGSTSPPGMGQLLASLPSHQSLPGCPSLRVLASCSAVVFHW